jgi:hypothetical protein
MILDVLIAGFVIALIDWNTGLHLTRVLKKASIWQICFWILIISYGIIKLTEHFTPAV